MKKSSEVKDDPEPTLVDESIAWDGIRVWEEGENSADEGGKEFDGLDIVANSLGNGGMAGCEKAFENSADSSGSLRKRVKKRMDMYRYQLTVVPSLRKARTLIVDHYVRYPRSLLADGRLANEQ